MISALSKNRVIGVNNTIPWHLPADLVWFRQHTINKPIILGRRTFESIGHPLPERLNIVLSRYPVNVKNVVWAHTPEQAITVASTATELMVIGGEKIYEIFLSYAKRLYLTYIDVEVAGDARFPYINLDEWRSVFIEYHNFDNRNIYNYCFNILDYCT